MKLLLAISTTLALTATGSLAQTIQQSGVLGQSGNPAFPLEVQGANGVVYNCAPNIESIGGVNARRCISSSGGAGVGNLGGLGGGAAVGVGVLALVAIAAGSDGSSTTTTTTP